MKFSDFDLRRDAEIFDNYSRPALARKLIAGVESLAASTRWATSEMACLTPFCEERARGKWLKPGQSPKSQLPHYEHWLSAANEVLGWVMTRGLYPTIMVKTQPKADQHEVILVRYSHVQKLDLDVVTRYVFQAGRLMLVRRTSRSNQGEQRFEWQSDRLLRSFRCYWEFNDDGSADPGTIIREDFEYDAFGALERVTSVELNIDGSENASIKKTIVFQKKSKTLTVSSLSTMIEDRLKQVLLQKLSEVEGYFYCLLLCYCNEDAHGAWPPIIVLGAAEERDRVVAAGKSIPYYLWAPDELRNRAPNVEVLLDDEPLANMCEQHLLLMEEADNFKPVIKTLQTVAKSLQISGLPATIRTTDHFVIAAVDNTAEVPPAKDIKSCVSKETFDALKKSGCF